MSRSAEQVATRVPDWLKLVLMGAFFVLFGGLSLVLSIGAAADERAYAATGVVARGVVVDRVVERVPGEDPDRYRLVYEFTTAGGDIVRGSGTVGRAAFDRFAVGAPISVFYVPERPALNRLDPLEASLVMPLAIGGFALVFGGAGVALAVLGLRRRRPPPPAPTAWAPSPTGRYRFDRPVSRLIVDLVVPPIGAAAFLGVAIALIVQPGTVERGGANVVIFIGLFALFGVVLLLATLQGIRRGVRRTILEIGPDGIWTPELGRLAWGDVADVRVESFRGFGGGDHGGDGTAPRTVRYRRLGIVPRDPELVRRADARAATRIGRFMSLVSERVSGRRSIDLAPFGVHAYELGGRFDEAVARIAEFRMPGQVSDMEEGGVEALLAAAEAPSDVAGPVSLPDRPIVFERRPMSTIMALSHGGSAVPATALLAFATVVILGAVRGGPFPFNLISLLFLALVVSVLVDQVLVLASLPGRITRSRGDEPLLEVGPDGLRLDGVDGLVAWSDVAEVAVRGGGWAVSGQGSGRRLEIVPSDPDLAAELPWAERARASYRDFLRRLLPWRWRSTTPQAGFVITEIEFADDIEDVAAVVRRYLEAGRLAPASLAEGTGELAPLASGAETT